MHAEGKQKIGFPVVNVAGRVGYLKRGKTESSLVIRNFAVNPSGEYIDIPWKRPGPSGCPIQACNIKAELGAFAELEYHTPAVGGSDGEFGLHDECQIWAFRGSDQDIASVAHTLLGLPARDDVTETLDCNPLGGN
jgi:hypothetical protein